MIDNQSLTASTTAKMATQLDFRRISIQNLGPSDVYVGLTATVSATNGLKLGVGDVYQDSGYPVAVPWVVTVSGTSSLAVVTV